LRALPRLDLAADITLYFCVPSPHIFLRSSGFRVGRREIESAEVKEDRALEAVRVAEASRSVLDELDLAVQARIEKFQENQHMHVEVAGLPANLGFDVFVIQVPTAPFGLSWYQGDISTNSRGGFD
jgi:hypothetical protein